jgi:hypothetical protein
MTDERRATLKREVRSILVASGNDDPRESTIEMWTSFIEMIVNAEAVKSATDARISALTEARDIVRAVVVGR